MFIEQVLPPVLSDGPCEMGIHEAPANRVAIHSFATYDATHWTTQDGKGQSTSCLEGDYLIPVVQSAVNYILSEM
jgi:hypothetical protein